MVWWLCRLRRPVGQMTVVEQQLEGEYRYVFSRLITHRCVIHTQVSHSLFVTHSPGFHWRPSTTFLWGQICGFYGEFNKWARTMDKICWSNKLLCFSLCSNAVMSLVSLFCLNAVVTCMMQGNTVPVLCCLLAHRAVVLLSNAEQSSRNRLNPKVTETSWEFWQTARRVHQCSCFSWHGMRKGNPNSFMYP